MFWTVSLPEVVIDPVDLPLLEHRAQVGVQLRSRREVVPERLLDHDPRPAVCRRRQPLLAEARDDDGSVSGGVAR